MRTVRQRKAVFREGQSLVGFSVRMREGVREGRRSWENQRLHYNGAVCEGTMVLPANVSVGAFVRFPLAETHTFSGFGDPGKTR